MDIRAIPDFDEEKENQDILYLAPCPGEQNRREEKDRAMTNHSPRTRGFHPIHACYSNCSYKEKWSCVLTGPHMTFSLSYDRQ
jgi:hypothetical protein